jgi:hypothetical protein
LSNGRGGGGGGLKINQYTDMPHLLFYGAQSIMNSARCHQARSKSGRLVQGKRVQLLEGWPYGQFKGASGWEVGLRVRMRAAKQENLERTVLRDVTMTSSYQQRCANDSRSYAS